jgi:tetratricopeptide (TPR) repeat protein
VQCRPNDRHRPLSAFVDLVPGLRTMRGAIGCSPETFSYLDRLTKQKSTVIDGRTSESDSEIVYAGVQQSLFDLIDAVADEGCLIVMIEDVHWLDSTSAKLLRDMVAWAVDHSIFFAFTGRDWPEDWARVPDGLTEIHLPPLDAVASKDVILGVVRQHGRELDGRYLDWCVRVAEGNPYFLQELANHWVETGNQNEIPSSLAAVLNERISRLSAEALLLLQTCALLETNATLDRIDKLISLEPHRMLAAINELGLAGMLVIEADDSGKNSPDRLLSRHDLLSNAALARLTPPARAFLHRRAGAVFEGEISGERSTSTLWDCAKHWQLAGNVGRAFQLATSCATHLMDVGLPGAAAEAYERCLDYCTAPLQTQQILEGQARAYFRACDWLSLGEAISKARRISSSINPKRDPHDDLELMALRAQWRNHRDADTLEQVHKCLDDTSASPEHRVEAGTLALMLLDETCNHAAMPRVYALVAKLAEAPGVRAAARLEPALVFHTICGDLSVAVTAARSLVDEQRNTGNVGDLLRALYNASVSLRAAGLFEEVEATLLEARSVAIDHKVQFALAEAYLHLANFHLELGQNDAARHDFERLRGHKITYDRRRSMLEFSGVAARLALLSNRPSEARRFVPRSIEELKRTPVVFSRVYSASLCVAVELACGRVPTKALLSVLEEAHLLSRRTTCQAYPAYALYVGLKAAGREERGSRLLNEYLSSNRREPYPPAPELLATLEGYLPLARKKRNGRRRLPALLPSDSGI